MAKLYRSTRFLLIGFGTTPDLFLPRPVPATSAARAKAVKWFTRKRTRGRTNLYDSVALALTHEEIDTIFLLT